MLLAGAAIEHLDLTADDGGVGGERLGRAIGGGPGLVLEVMEGVDAAHQRGAVARTDRLLHMAGGRSGVPRDAGGYGEILAALKRITTPANVTKICGENWFRVFDSAKA